MKLLLVIVAAALAAGCAKPETRSETLRPVRTAVVAESGAGEWLLSGDVRPRYETRLSFRLSGQMLARKVEVGQRVQAGQTVAVLDGRDARLAESSARAALAQAQTQATLAQADLKRFTELRAKNFISQAEYDRRANALATAQSQLAAARAQAAQVANQVGYATLIADVAGVVTAVEAEAGQVVAAGQTVVRVAQPGEKEIVFAVPESQRSFMEGSSSFQVSLNAVPGKTWKAKLREVSPAADPVTRMYAARASILEAGDEIELGMSAAVEVASAAARKIEVPIAALHSRGADPQVFVVEPKGTVRAQKVKTGGVTGERVVIESGLQPGDVVVAAGAQLLRPGQRVRVLDEK